MSKTKSPDKFQEFKQYVMWWVKFFGLTHYEWWISTAEKDQSTEMGTAVASATFYQELNIADIKLFPRGLDQPLSRLWQAACHEVCHILMAPYRDYIIRHAPNSEDFVQEETILLEQFVDMLSRRLSKRLTRRAVGGKIQSKDPDKVETGYNEHIISLSEKFPRQSSLSAQAG